MSGWDEGGVFYHNPNGDALDDGSENADPTVAQSKFLKFIRNFRHNNAYIYRYRIHTITYKASKTSIIYYLHI